MVELPTACHSHLLLVIMLLTFLSVKGHTFSCVRFSEPVDFNAEVNLYHFDCHRAVGKGAFGKVPLTLP